MCVYWFVFFFRSLLDYLSYLSWQYVGMLSYIFSLQFTLLVCRLFCLMTKEPFNDIGSCGSLPASKLSNLYSQPVSL